MQRPEVTRNSQGASSCSWLENLQRKKPYPCRLLQSSLMLCSLSATVGKPAEHLGRKLGELGRGADFKAKLQRLPVGTSVLQCVRRAAGWQSAWRRWLARAGLIRTRWQTGPA